MDGGEGPQTLGLHPLRRDLVGMSGQVRRHLDSGMDILFTDPKLDTDVLLGIYLN